jgi:hypothetical protein
MTTREYDLTHEIDLLAGSMVVTNSFVTDDYAFVAVSATYIDPVNGEPYIDSTIGKSFRNPTDPVNVELGLQLALWRAYKQLATRRERKLLNQSEMFTHNKLDSLSRKD